jgi:hypothetical protein
MSGTFLGFTIVLNAFCFWFSSNSWVRWLNLCFVVGALSGIALVTISNYMAGCFGAPEDVEFHQGMTICPGQTAHGAIVLPSLADKGI